MSNNMSADKKKVLITGANGQLGQELVKIFKSDWDVVATDTHNIDITNKSQVKKVIGREKLDWIIHCAAWTNVDAAAENPEAAMKVNGVGTKNVCEAAKGTGAKVVYVSTNEVFGEDKKEPYLENDKINPLTAYGKSKAAGEEFCQQLLEKDCVVVRSSWLYGSTSTNNFPNKILKKAAEQRFLKVTADEVSTPTYTLDLAVALKKIVEKNTSGVFHLVNEGSASRYEWAREIVKEKGLKVPIEPISLDLFERASKPPKYSVLANVRAKNLGIVLRDWQEASNEYLSKLV